jgi:alginate O-acetyltransferase complex protein AlgI
MNFVQFEFVVFMAVVFALYWGVSWLPGGLLNTRRLQNALLVVASCVFYGWSQAWFLVLLFTSASTDFVGALAIERYPRFKPYILMVTLAINLGMLAYFKYYNFFLDSVIDLMASLGLRSDLHLLSIMLPVGISFYTFQTISYTIDVYRGDLKARTDLLDYFLYVTFFPQLVAGPIERAPSLLVQVERSRSFDVERIIGGLTLAMWGAFKKMCVADTLAPYIDKVFVLESPSTLMVWAACLAFSVQIFADFSGYTDIARGTARMLGFELTENFRSPYLAASTPEFWQRWHISLSFWIRDYLLVPLLGAGRRLTTFRFVWATIVTFLVIGLWHGASWNFLLFGLWHGVWLTAYTLAMRVQPAWTYRIPLGRPLAVLFHFFAVSVPGSLLFRETHVERIGQYLTQNPFAMTLDEWIATSVVLGMTALMATPLILSHFVVRYVVPRAQGNFWLTLPLQTGSWAVFAMMIFVFYRVSTQDFIYFQF